MTKHLQRYIKSQYKYVSGIYNGYTTKWYIRFSNVSMDLFETEREAAIAADKKLIERGFEPVNILKRINP